MRNVRILVVGLIALVVGAAAFAATRAMRPTEAAAATDASEVLLDWLNVPAARRAEIRQHDPTFARELQTLRQQLADKRQKLASLLEKEDASNEQILRGVQEVIEANSAMELRITRYLLEVRDHLTPEQRQRLFGLCAQGVREGPGCWRMGGEGGRGMGPGRGMGWRRGQQGR